MQRLENYNTKAETNADQIPVDLGKVNKHSLKMLNSINEEEKKNSKNMLESKEPKPKAKLVPNFSINPALIETMM